MRVESRQNECVFANKQIQDHIDAANALEQASRIEHAKEQLAQGKSRREVAHLLNVSTVTLWRATQGRQRAIDS